MRAAELIGSRVYDRDGRGIGRVHDVRIEASGPAEDGSGQPAYRICAFTVGSVAIAQRFGYGRGQMAGPWPLTAIFRAMARRSVMVGWPDVTCLAPGRVETRRVKAELESVLEADETDEDGASRGGAR